MFSACLRFVFALIAAVMKRYSYSVQSDKWFKYTSMCRLSCVPNLPIPVMNVYYYHYYCYMSACIVVSRGAVELYISHAGSDREDCGTNHSPCASLRYGLSAQPNASYVYINSSDGPYFTEAGQI